MAVKPHPLSPHIQIYKPQISSFTSILHRITGAFLYLGVVVICWTIIHCAYQVDVLMDSPEVECQYCFLQDFGLYLLYAVIIAWSFSLYYHLCNGIRHLFWDIGKGFEIRQANRNSIIVLMVSIAMTLASIAFIACFKLI